MAYVSNGHANVSIGLLEYDSILVNWSHQKKYLIVALNIVAEGGQNL